MPTKYAFPTPDNLICADWTLAGNIITYAFTDGVSLNSGATSQIILFNIYNTKWQGFLS